MSIPFQFTIKHESLSSRFSQQDKVWKQQPINTLLNEPQDINMQDTLKIGTYNILSGAPKISFNFLLRNQQRFDHIVQFTVPQTNSDILGFCEVNQQFLNTFKNSKFCKKNYYLSSTEILFKEKSHELVLCSKYPFKSYIISHHIKGSKKDQYLIALFPNLSNPEKSFLVIQSHTQAFESYYQIREKQLNFLNQLIINFSIIDANILQEKDEKLNNCIYQAALNNNIILQGDLNLHHPFETKYIYQHNFIDVWLEKHGLIKKGYTWDSKVNTLINIMLPFDNRRMRLDRVCLRENSTLFDIKDIQVLGQELIGVALCGSDHYMLQGEFKIKQELSFSYVKKFNFQNNYLKNFLGVDTGFRSISKIIQLRTGSIFLLLILIYIIFKML